MKPTQSSKFKLIPTRSFFKKILAPKLCWCGSFHFKEDYRHNYPKVRQLKLQIKTG